MSNFYIDNQDILFHLQKMELSRIISLKEEDFTEKDSYLHAPENFEDALDNCHKVLEIVGDIAGRLVAPKARGVDREGAKFRNGEVHYATGTREALDQLKKADLMGFTLPRHYGGLNMPKTIYSIAIEIISRADASLMNLFGLQEIADTIQKFGFSEQKDAFLPRFSSGEVSGAMALTEPDAGSDLQSITLSATPGEDGYWYLNGVKRFITNGCADVLLILARSEPGSTGGRGLSLFLYERDSSMQIRRIEDKLGIHGSPTCELQFNNARAQLLGRRKMGLVRYTLSLMNGARLGVAAQAVGLAEAAYREADNYSRQRKQFKTSIRNFSAVSEMLTCMRVQIEATRTLLYETSRVVDIAEELEEKMQIHPEQNLKEEAKLYYKYASLLTPALKIYSTEMANQVCYDALQVYGGPGYTRDFDIERLYRDARITNIYEGTTQLQVPAAIGGIITGVFFERLKEYQASYDFEPVQELFSSAQRFRDDLDLALGHIKDKNDSRYQEFHSRRLVDIALDTIIAYLLCIDALYSERKKQIAGIFISRAQYRVREKLNYILSDDYQMLKQDSTVIDSY